MSTDRGKYYKLALSATILGFISLFMPTSFHVSISSSYFFLVWMWGFVLVYSSGTLNANLFYYDAFSIPAIVFLLLIFIGTVLLLVFTIKVKKGVLKGALGIIGSLINIGGTILYISAMEILIPNIWTGYWPCIGVVLPIISGIIGLVAGIKISKA
ncbi:MAG: hypothetical protein ACP6IY_21855 [Promethearchaeia archaeon]